MEDRDSKRPKTGLENQANQEGDDEAQEQINPRQETCVREAVGNFEGNIVRIKPGQGLQSTLLFVESDPGTKRTLTYKPNRPNTRS
eukprot:14524276-Heterocapsa_arctica.AAC.1